MIGKVALPSIHREYSFIYQIVLLRPRISPERTLVGLEVVMSVCLSLFPKKAESLTSTLLSEHLFLICKQAEVSFQPLISKKKM